MFEFYFKIGRWTIQVSSCSACPDKMKSIEGMHTKSDFSLEIKNPSTSVNSNPNGVNGFTIQQGAVRIQSFLKEVPKRVRLCFANNEWYKGYTALEMMLVRAFYSLAKEISYKSFLVHASAVVRKNGAYLFLGPSKSGKTTVGGLSINQGHLLHDELVVVHVEDSLVLVQGTPFHSDLPMDSESIYPVEAIFFLKRGNKISFQPMDTKQTFIQILRQAAPPIGFDSDSLQINDTQLDATFNFSLKLANHVPAYAMALQPKNSFWPLIDKL